MPERYVWQVTLDTLTHTTAAFGRIPGEASATISRDDWERVGEPHVLYLTNEEPERG